MQILVPGARDRCGNEEILFVYFIFILFVSFDNQFKIPLDMLLMQQYRSSFFSEKPDSREVAYGWHERGWDLKA